MTYLENGTVSKYDSFIYLFYNSLKNRLIFNCFMHDLFISRISFFHFNYHLSQQISSLDYLRSPNPSHHTILPQYHQSQKSLKVE